MVLFRWADVTDRLPGGRIDRSAGRDDEPGGVGNRPSGTVPWSSTCGATTAFRNTRLWSIDRLHLSAAGHRRVAAHVLEALGVTAEPSWLAAVPPPERLSWTRARAADARWATQHLAPWIKRRLTGRSSGDLVQPKRPALEPVT